MVRLLTQNLIACPAKTCSFPSNFPLAFKNVQSVEIVETEFNEEFLRGYLNRIEWNALRKSAAELGNTDLPETEPDLSAPNDISVDLLKTLHHVLLEIQVQDGTMVCPSCSHTFVIKEGIPNMLLAEHELRK